MFVRKQYLDRIQHLLKEEKLIMLTGARQVGKTTILGQLFDIYQSQLPVKIINCENRLLRPFDTRESMISWFLIEHNIDILKDGLLMLDEIQVWDKIEVFLKIIADDNTIKTKFIATGSRFLGQSIAGSTLVGRGGNIKIFPFSFKEFLQSKGKNITSLLNIEYNWIDDLLQEYLLFGGYPDVIFSSTKKDKIHKLKKIIDSWIDKDFGYFIKNEYKSSFIKVLQHIVLNIGNLYKEDKLSSNLGLSKSVIKNMVQFLNKSFISFDVYPFFSDKTKEYNKAFEIFLQDIGWINYLRGILESNISDGKNNENFVATQCLYDPDNTLYFYNKRNGSEIDFVVKDLFGKLIPIEVKSGDKTLIPRSFNYFFEVYGNIIKYAIVTTKSIFSQKTLHGINIYFVPFRKISDFLKNTKK